MDRSGLFVGLVTLDFLYLTSKIPTQNQKVVASDYQVCVGGPATNAAITFAYLQQFHGDGGHTQLIGTVGNHVLSHLILRELETYQVHLIDLDAQRSEPPPVSSILVTEPGGDRAVISINATQAQGQWQPELIDSLALTDILLIDGHQIAVSQQLVPLAKSHHIPIILDGGSWKPGLETLLPGVDVVIASDHFYPPGCDTTQKAIAYLLDLGISQIAITHGAEAIDYHSQRKSGQLSVPRVTAVDTLGAGDIFHGAFCYYSLELEFVDALAKAAIIASESVRYLGTRAWMNSPTRRSFL